MAHALVKAQNNDRHFTDGRLRNAYQAGDVLDLANGHARLPGWWNEDLGVWREDRYNAGTHAGNLAWAMIALLQLYKREQDTMYLSSSLRLGEWIVANCCDTSGYGGYRGGLEGWAPETKTGQADQSAVAWKSTEHNIDIWCAFMHLFELTQDTEWREWASHARRFVEAMWDESEGRFYTGTDLCIDHEEINRSANPLDVNPWAVMALGDTRYLSSLDWCQRECFVEICDSGCGFHGFDFNDDRDGVWYEGTAQMAVAYQIAGDSARAEELLQTLRLVQERAEGTDGKGIVAACHDSISTGFGWVYYSWPHVGATAWYIFAETRFNPYWGISTDEQIPYQDTH
jgi:hypothetical protein